MQSALNDNEVSEVEEQRQMDSYKAAIAHLQSNIGGGYTAGVNPKDLVGMTKPPLALVPPCFEVYVSMAMKNGAKKYGLYTWRKEKVQSMIYLDAAKRHISSFIDGETNSKDAGVHHLAHAAACCAILLDAFLNDCVIDNRPPPGKTAELIEQLTEKKP